MSEALKKYEQAKKDGWEEIREIDAQITKLQEQRDSLVKAFGEPPTKGRPPGTKNKSKEQEKEVEEAKA